MLSVEAYHLEIYEELLNSEVSQEHEFNDCDVDHLIIDEIHSRIPAEDTDKWIADNPNSLEARTIKSLE